MTYDQFIAALAGLTYITPEERSTIASLTNAVPEDVLLRTLQQLQGVNDERAALLEQREQSMMEDLAFITKGAQELRADIRRIRERDDHTQESAQAEQALPM